jgi:flagellar hook protein FlgE
MLDLYVMAINSIRGLTQALRVATSNAINFSTPGHKYAHASFTSVYSEALSSGTLDTNPIDLGQGATLGSISTDFSQGPITLGQSLDIAILGEGFFVISRGINASAAGVNLYTRAGRFRKNTSNEFIVDDQGRKLYGYKTDKNGDVISTVLEPIQTGGAAQLSFIEGGVLVSNEGEPNQKALYKVALTTFKNKDGLIPVVGGAFKSTIASGEAFATGTAGDAIGSGADAAYGDVLARSLESSNVDIPKAALDMNILNRNYKAQEGLIEDFGSIYKSLMGALKA